MVDSLIALLGGFEHNCLEQNAFHTPRSQKNKNYRPKKIVINNYIDLPYILKYYVKSNKSQY